jgi:hypothetical protein
MSSNLDKQEVKQSATTQSLLWPTSDSPLPANPLVSLFFAGLCAFCYRSPNCEVGFHRGDGKHKFKIKLFEKPGCHDITPDLPEKIKQITVEIASKASSVDFYEKGSFNRLPSDDPHDFRWLLDLDGHDFYHENIDKVTGVFKTKLTVKHGRFYTYSTTNSKFDRVNVEDLLDTLHLNQVAAWIGAAIEVQSAEHVVITIDKLPPIKLYPGTGKNYELHFLNECEENGTPCHFIPMDPDEEKRNDFHFMRKVLKLKSKRTKYGLHLATAVGLEPPSPKCAEHAQLNDEAPCMGTGFGQTNGFP